MRYQAFNKPLLIAFETSIVLVYSTSTSFNTVFIVWHGCSGSWINANDAVRFTSFGRAEIIETSDRNSCGLSNVDIGPK